MENNIHKKEKMILDELEPIATSALESHILNKDSKEWHPGEVVPFEKVTETPDLDSASKSALFINGLTEDNLAHYTSTLKRLFGREGAWAEWNNRWTWEESLHGRAIERFLDHINIFDSKWLESARKKQLSSGQVPEPDTVTEIAIYTSIQEELTRLAHSRLSQRLQGVGRKIFALIAGDELRHHHFYNTIATSIRERFPDEFAESFFNVIKRFDMPGVGIPGFKEHSNNIENAGIFTSQDVAKTIYKMSSANWSIDSLEESVISDSNKKLSEKIQRRLGTYKKIAEMTINKTIDSTNLVIWEKGKPIFL